MAPPHLPRRAQAAPRRLAARPCSAGLLIVALGAVIVGSTLAPPGAFAQDATSSGSTPPSPSEGEPAVRSAARRLRVVVTGETGGISSWSMTLKLGGDVARFARTAGGSTEDVYTGLGSVHDRGVVLVRLDGQGLGSSAMGRFLDAPPFEQRPREGLLRGLVSPTELLVQLEPDQELPALLRAQTDLRFVAAAKEVAYRAVEVRNATGQTVLALVPADRQTFELSAELVDYELSLCAITRLTLPGREATATVVQVARAWGEGSRRLGLVRDKTAEADRDGVPHIVLDAGGALDGYSYVREQSLSLHRPNDWDALQAEGLDVLAPGEQELLEPLEVLRTKAKAHGIALVAANLLDPKGATVLPPWVLLRRGDLVVAVTAVIDPAIVTQLPAEQRAALRIGDPAEALAGMRGRIAAEVGREPDLVILLSTAGPELIAGLDGESQFDGFDAIFGDFRRQRFADRRARFDGLDARVGRAGVGREPFVQHRGHGGEVAVMDVEFTEGAEARARSATVEALNVTAERQEVPAWTRKVMAVRHAVYEDTDRVVIPDLTALIRGSDALLAKLRTEPPWSGAHTLDAVRARVDTDGARLTAPMWRQLVANVVRDRTDADLVAVRDLPFPVQVGGATRLIFVLSYLATPETLVRYRLTGDKADAVVAALSTMDGVSTSGIDRTTRKIGGRPIQPARTYTLVTTPRLASLPPLRDLLAPLPSEQGCVEDGWALVCGSGAAMPLKVAVRSGLEQLRDTLAPEADAVDPYSPYGHRIADLLADQHAPPPEWSLWVRDAHLALSNNSTTGGRTAFAKIPDTRIATPDNLSVDQRLDLSLIRDSETLAAEARLRAAYGELRVGDETTELADDLTAAVELRLNALQLEWLGASAPLLPFLSASWDSEFTRIDGADARQNNLRGTLGLTMTPHGAVQELRVGALAELDLANRDAPLEFGGELVATLAVDLGPLVLKTAAGLLAFLPDSGDTDDDLGLVVHVRPALGLPLFERLAFALFADAYVFRGKVAPTDRIGTSLILGAELSFDRIFVF